MIMSQGFNDDVDWSLMTSSFVTLWVVTGVAITTLYELPGVGALIEYVPLTIEQMDLFIALVLGIAAAQVVRAFFLTSVSSRSSRWKGFGIGIVLSGLSAFGAVLEELRLIIYFFILGLFLLLLGIFEEQGRIQTAPTVLGLVFVLLTFGAFLAGLFL